MPHYDVTFKPVEVFAASKEEALSIASNLIALDAEFYIEVAEIKERSA